MGKNFSFHGSKIKSRIFRGIGANAYGQLISVGIQLISVPAFIYFWGVELYGEWLILSAIPAYLSLSDIGFASVAGNEMTMLTAKGDQKGALQVYQSIWLLISTISILIASIVGLILVSLPLHNLLSFKHIFPNEGLIALYILFLYALISLQGGVFSAGFRSGGSYAYGTMLTNTIRLTEWALAIVALALQSHVVGVAMALLIGRVTGTIALWLALRYKAPWLVLGYRAGKLSTIRTLFKPALAFMAFPLGLAMNIQGMLLVIGILVGPVAVTIFTAYRTLTRLLVQVITIINQAIWPEISAAYGTGAINLVNNLHQRGSAITFWIGLAGTISIGISGDLIISTWTNYAFEPKPILLALLLTAGFLHVLWQASWVMLMATNRHEGISIAFLMSTATGLVACIVCSSHFGINAAGFGLIIGELPMLFYTIRCGLRLLNNNFYNYAITIFRMPFKSQSLDK